MGGRAKLRFLSLLLASSVLAFLAACGGGSGGNGGGGGGGGNPPPVPTGLTATAQDQQIALNWTARAGATSYNVKRASSNAGPYSTISSPTGTAYTDSGLTNGTTYYYVVSAVNANGESGNSTAASATPNAAIPAAPTGVNAIPGNAQVSLSWTASASGGVTGYHLKRSTTSGGPYTQVATSPATYASDTGLTNGTHYYYVVTAVAAAGESGNSAEVSATPLSTITNVSLTIDVYTNRHAISPYVYGAAFPKNAATITDSGLPVVRWGGNGASTYNWKLGTSNADNDYYFEDFSFGALNNAADSDSTQFIKDVQAAGSNPLMTMVMLPWVAQSAETSITQGGTDNYHWTFSVTKDGACSAVGKVDQYNIDAGVNLDADCSTAMVASNAQLNRTYYPLLDDHSQACSGSTCEYRSDWASALAGAFNTPSPTPTCPIPYSTITSCHFYDMDNEIDIWGGTHVDVHPNPTTYDELSSIYLTEAAKLKTWDPQAVRMGWVSCCWYYYWNSAAGGSDKSTHANIDFMPWWLNQVAWQDAVNGSRTLDIFDLHAYPETSSSGLTTAQARALTLRSTRDWWDPTYTSEAWFGTVSVTAQQPEDGKAFRIPRARAWANTIYPGTPLAFTEWNFALGNDADFSSALADADAYGILGRERVSLATRWTAPDPANPNYLALKLYTNYDGAHHGFAPISVSATNTGDPNLFSTYAATSVDGTTITLMVVNKDPNNTASVNLNLAPLYGLPSSITTYTLAASSPSAIAVSTPTITPVMNFPPYSATLLVMTFTPGHLNVPQSEWDLNPDTLVIAAGGTATLQPRITSGTANVDIINESATGLGIGSGGTITPTQPGMVTISVPSGTAPGFYPFSVTGAQNFPTFQKGWVIVTNPAATFTKTGDNQTGGSLPLKVTLAPGSSGGTASGASILFTTDKGTLSQRIVNTDSSGNASVTLTLPSGSGTATVTAEGPYGLGHPVATFTESN